MTHYMAVDNGLSMNLNASLATSLGGHVGYHHIIIDLTG